MQSYKSILFLTIFALIFADSRGQNFITRSGSKLMYQDQEIHLRGFSFGNKVWSNVELPTDHHNEEDFLVLKELGMNAIRFYMNYLTFESDGNPYQYKQSGWEWIDKNLEWARKHNIFLILNMHVPQGGFQSQCQGEALWENEENQKRLAALWKAIAARYKNEPIIAGYDIVNEPTPSQSVSQWTTLAQRIIDSIRSVDNNHLIITERAIAVNCDYAFNDGKYNYPDVQEENLMYTVHLYDPYEYTHQNQNWANTGDGGKYPDETIFHAPSDAEYATGHYANPGLPSGNSDWKYYEGVPYQVNADSLILGRVIFNCGNLGTGKAYYDDITLTEVDAQGNVIKEIYKINLNSGVYWFWSENSDGTQSTSSQGHNDNFSVTCTGTTGNATIIASTLPFKPEKGKRYKISGWMKGENIPQNGRAAISTEFYYSPSGKSVYVRNKEYLRESILNYSKYLRERNYPVYFGEFGVVRNAFENNKGGHLWVKDAIDIFDSLGFHFTYHVYREDAFGYYAGWDGPVDRSTVLTDLENTFKDFFGVLSTQTALKQNGMRLYPNPFSDSIIIENTSQKKSYISIYDEKGNLLQKDEIGKHSKKHFENFPGPGVYLIKIISGDKIQTVKVLHKR